jgi:hypothetical protein
MQHPPTEPTPSQPTPTGPAAPPGFQQPGPGSFQQPYPGSTEPPPKPKTSVLAVLAFVFGFLPLFPLTIVLGILAMVRIRRTGEFGRGMAITSLICSGLWIAAVAFSLVSSLSSEDDAANNLKPGDCVTQVKTGDNSDLKVLPCDQPNGGKVFAVIELPDGKWPGIDGLQAEATKGCNERLAASGETPDEASNLWSLYPNSAAWRQGDRAITCLIAPS